jgi:predicted nucleotidyltransferase
VDTGRPYADVIPGPRGQILATLGQLEAPLTVRALARQASVSPQRALEIVGELSDAGIVESERAGSALMVSLNREHLAATPILELISLRRRLVQKLERELSEWHNLAAAWLFGSTARGDGDQSSDVDILLVADSTLDDRVWSTTTAQLREQLHVWTGNEAHIVELTRTSFLHLSENGNALIDALRTEAIPLTRTSRVLLRGHAA